MKFLTDAIDRFCRKHPRFGISNLMLYIVIGNVAVYLMDLFSNSTFSSILIFSRNAILRGEVWRLLTFVFVPTSGGSGFSGIFFFAITLYFYYFIGSAIEQQWGSGRFTCFYLTGMLISILFGMIAGTTDIYYVNMSMFFALATLYPNLQFLLFFIIPVKAKWLAWLDAAMFLYESIFVLSFPYSLLPLTAIVNYLLFFGGDLFDWLRRALGLHTRPKHNRNTVNFKKEAKRITKEQGYLHKCAVCGRTDVSDPELEFRYCSKCAGYHCYCMDHINSHIHIQ